MRALIMLAAGVMAWGQDAPHGGVLTQGERDRAMSYLHATMKQVSDTVAGLEPRQMAFHAGPNRWSVGDCLEHLALTESALFGMLTGKVMTSPAAPEQAALLRGRDEALVKAIASRAEKLKAPEALVPSHRWKTTAETLAAFRAERRKTIAYVESTQDALRTHVSQGDPSMDGYQVILMIGAHTERHLAQMKEVVADPHFPGRH